MPRISLNVVVFNEEARLEECLLDARDHVDEIVVVDQMSTDGTPEVAERLADVYIRDIQHGHAEPSRELAASRSSGDWILILDADEKMSELLKAELRTLVDRDIDGYWIEKSNLVDGVEVSTVQHLRLVRKSRARFDPGLHREATMLTDNIERFERIGIIHEKTSAEQIYDDARYERIALEDEAPTASKRNWLSHNRTLRAERARSRRSDLEALVPADADRVLVLGDLAVEFPDRNVSRSTGASENGAVFDAVVVELSGEDTQTALRSLAGLVRPGGTVVGTAPAARNRRRLEEYVATIVSDDGHPASPASTVGTTRRALLDGLAAVGLDATWTSLVRDGWLNPVALRPDGSGSVVESDDFFLRRVSAEVAEELTAQEILFSAVRRDAASTCTCAIVVAAVPGVEPDGFLAALRATEPANDHELVVVPSRPGAASLAALWNEGARAARSELLVFVSAAAVPEPGWLDALVETYRSRPDTACAGSKVLAADGTIAHAGLVLGPDGVPYRIYEGERPTAAHVNRPRVMPAVLAEGMITSRTRFVEVGGFDETLGEDLADADYCLRQRTRGRPVLYAPSATLVSPMRPLPGTRTSFRRSAREFATRWLPTTFRSDELVCRADGRDASWEWNRSWRLPRPAAPRGDGLPAVAWSSHFLEQGGYTEEALAAVEALDEAGLRVVVNPVTWDRMGSPLPPRKAKRLADLMARHLPDDFVHVAHIGANRFKRHPDAIWNVGRTMFETDGLPADWRDQCNAMDEIWVPSDHNLHTFARAGVDPAKLHKVPETFDTEIFDPHVEPLAVEGLSGFVFLSMFSWIDRKAWDILIRAWFAEFAARDDVTLLLKTDAALAPPGTDCRREVERFVREQLGTDLERGPRIVVLDRQLEATDVPRLYRAADAFVLASHGEGWGRPYMEAMAMGLPTIATRWSGNLEFMDDDNSYLLGYTLVEAAPAWMRGQRWAEPSLGDLRRVMRRVYEHPEEAARVGARAQADVRVSCRPELVAEAVQERLEAIVRRSRPPARREAPGERKRPAREGRRIGACVVVREDESFLGQCLASLEQLADTIVVVEAGSRDDMASVRNEALEQLTGGWVLMLDAAQTLDPASVGLVRNLVNRDLFVGYAVRELHQFGLDGAVAAAEQRTVSLFPRHPDLRYVGRVGEQLLPLRDDLDFRLVQSWIVLYRHGPFEPRDSVSWARRQLPLLERSVREEPGEPFHLYNLGVALHRLGLHVEADSALRRALKLDRARALWRPAALLSLSQAVAAQGRGVEAVKLATAAIEAAPDWAGAWCRLGDALADVARTNEALDAYRHALACCSEAVARGDAPDDVGWRVRAGIARIHLAREEYAEAADCLGGALAVDPTSTELRVMLAQALEKAGRQGGARRHLEHVVMRARAGTDAYLALGDFYAKRAEEALLRGLVDSAENPALLERIERLREARA